MFKKSRLFQRQPSIFRPVDFLLNQDAGAILWHAITMTEEVIAIRERVGRAMTHRLIFLLVAFQQQGATAIAHVLAILVQIRTSHLLASAHGNTIVALDATAAVIPAHEEIVITTMFHDERSLDGIGTGKLDRKSVV